MSDSPDRDPVSRDEFERLQRRVDHLERLLAPPPRPPVAPVEYRAPPPAPAQAPAARPSPSPPPAPSPAPAAKPTMETLVGQRFAPRVGALLVFLATLFFLGVAIQRGWI